MPSTSEKMWEQLNVGENLSKINLDTGTRWGRIKPGTTIRKGAALFPRIEKG
jgi:methionyl-tRNA synthetase